MKEIVCDNCEEHAGVGSSCQNCGQRVYRYATDEAFESSVLTPGVSEFDEELEATTQLSELEDFLKADSQQSLEPRPPAPSPPPAVKSTVEPMRMPPPMKAPAPARRKRRVSFRLVLFAGFIIFRLIQRLASEF